MARIAATATTAAAAASAAAAYVLALAFTRCVCASLDWSDNRGSPRWAPPVNSASKMAAATNALATCKRVVRASQA